MISTNAPNPVLDIIVLVHDQAAHADLCIRSVENLTKNPYRLILVDNASKEPETLEMLHAAESRGHRVVHLTENKSFSNGVNVGVEAGSSPYVCILNDDCVVTEGWDGALMQDCTDKHIGMVGARTNYAAGFQGNPGLIGDPPYLVFVCVALRRAVWETIGQMDEVTFDGFSSEDLDYSWQVLKGGYKLKISRAFVYHAGSRTLNATVGDPEARRLNDAKYNARLIEKWGKDWYFAHTRLAQNILVNTYHAEEWTRVAFMGNFAELKLFMGNTFKFHHSQRAPIHIARQSICDYALDNGFDVLVQLDDDATFPPDFVNRFLSYNKEVVCALAYQRKPPHWPCAFEVGPDGILGAPLEGIERTGLRKVDVSGLHCSVLRTSVIQKLRDAGIRQYFGGFENKVGEDFAWSLNLKKLGIPMYVDTDLISGHIGSAVVIDERYKKEFMAGLHR